MFLYLLKKLDWVLVMSVLVLCLIGLLSIYSTSFSSSPTFFYKQLAFIVGGFFLMIIFALLDYRIFRNHPRLLIALYILSILLLAGVLIFGKEIRGAFSWFRIGPISFEPVELAKLVMILILAQYFSLRHIELYRLRHIIASGIYIAIPAFFQFPHHAANKWNITFIPEVIHMLYLLYLLMFSCRMILPWNIIMVVC